MGKKVIVIDDSLVARKQVINVLVQNGFEVVEAVDGRDGFDKIAANGDASMVICDVNMPKMSGIELLAQIKATGTGAAVPFLMLTTEAQPELVQQARSNGAKGWIIKPIKPDLLLAAVKKLAA